MMSLENDAVIVDERLREVKARDLRFTLDSHGVFSESMPTVSGTAPGARIKV
jgi:hypothetical protein